MAELSVPTGTQNSEAPAALSAAANAEYQLRNTQTRVWPYPHTLVRPIVPGSYYREMISHFPEDDAFVQLNEYHPDRGAIFLTPDRNGASDDQHRLDDTQLRFWNDFVIAFSSDRFRAALLECMGGPELVRTHLSITRSLIHLSLDRKGYQIRPHTDVSKKIVTALFYLPDEFDDTLAPFGTSVLAQREHADHLDPHDWERYESVFTAPFVSNSMLAFRVGDCSWHGVHPVERTIRRRSIQYFVFLDD